MHDLRPLETLSVDGLVRLWAHEALRLFQDRLVDDIERQWTNENINIVAMKHFPGINKEEALQRPILYSNWLHKDYVPVERKQLRDYVAARLKVLQFFYVFYLCLVKNRCIMYIYI
jgi:dynein heavy chain 1